MNDRRFFNLLKIFCIRWNANWFFINSFDINSFFLLMKTITESRSHTEHSTKLICQIASIMCGFLSFIVGTLFSYILSWGIGHSRAFSFRNSIRCDCCINKTTIVNVHDVLNWNFFSLTNKQYCIEKILFESTITVQFWYLIKLHIVYAYSRVFLGIEFIDNSCTNGTLPTI